MRWLRSPASSSRNALPTAASSTMASRPRRILPLSLGWRWRMRDTTAGGTRSASTLLPEQLVERIERRLSLEGAQALADLAHQLPVASDRDRLLPAFGLVPAAQHR